MTTQTQRSGMYGVYLVAAKLASRGFTVSVISRNAAGADLLVTDDRCARAWSVPVKAYHQADGPGSAAMCLLAPQPRCEGAQLSDAHARVHRGSREREGLLRGA